MSEQHDLDAPIIGGASIAKAIKWPIDKLYYKHERGLLAGIVFKNGGELVTSRRQLQKLATTTIESSKK